MSTTGHEDGRTRTPDEATAHETVAGMMEMYAVALDDWRREGRSAGRPAPLVDEYASAALAGIAATPLQGACWTPTSEAIDALPGPIRSYIHDLESRADPAGEVRELVICRDSLVAMERRVAEAETVLTSIEWGLPQVRELGPDETRRTGNTHRWVDACPSCRCAKEAGHARNCRLARCLREQAPPPPVQGEEGR